MIDIVAAKCIVQMSFRNALITSVLRGRFGVPQMVAWKRMLAIGVAVTADAASAGVIDVPFDDGVGLTGILSLVDLVTGPPPGAAYFVPPDPPGPNDFTLIWQVSVTSGATTKVAIGLSDGVALISATGAGWIPNNPTRADVAGVTGTVEVRAFAFDPSSGVGGNQNGAMNAGEVSDLFFTSYPPHLAKTYFASDSLQVSFMMLEGVPTFIVEFPCEADLDGDDIVGFGDLTALLVAWGPCAECPEDLDASGAVDFSDLATLLGAWGPCPTA